MRTLFKDLDFSVTKEVVLINVPSTLEIELSFFYERLVFCDLKEVHSLNFCLAFVTQQNDLNRIVTELTPKIKEDAILWFVYPQLNSIYYANPITNWSKLVKLGYERVQHTSLDNDWLALKFISSTRVTAALKVFNL